MKKVIYIYVLDTLADWEIGYILQAIQMQNMLKEPKYLVKTVARTKESIKTLGGLTLIPDCSLEEIGDHEIAALLLPGAQTWHEHVHKPILERAVSYIEKGILVGAICGATLALADLGILNNHLHTSNSLGYLCSFSKNYTGKFLYKDEFAVTDDNIITASSAGGLLWAKQIIEYLNMYSDETTQAWYKYYLTGDAKYYMELLSSME
ncbi:MAG: DJ-1/PfpI family protein [Zhenhengia sp.]